MVGLRGKQPGWSRGGIVVTLFVLAVAAGDLTLQPLIALRLATVLMLLSGAVALWSARRTQWRRPVPIALLVLGAVVAAWLPVALLRAPDLGEGRAEAQGLAAGIAVALAATALSRGTSSGLTAMRRGWMLALALSVLVGLVELVTDTHLWVDPTYSWAADHRTIIAGAFRNPNDFAIALAAMISGTLTHLGSGPQRPAARCAVACLAALGTVGVLLTQSRSGLAALVVVLVVHALLRLRRPGRVAGLRRGAALATGLAVTAVVAASFLVPPLAARNPVLQAIRASLEPGTARSDALRLDLIRAAIRYFGSSDGLGTGAASFEVLLARDPAPGVATRTWLHNSFVELLLQYGVVVAGMLGVVLLVTALAALRPGSRTSEVVLARTDALACLLVFAALGCASATVVTSPFWWLLLGQACASAWWLQTARAVEAPPTPAGSPDVAVAAA